MIVDDKVIEKLAKLSSLEIDENKKESLKEELANILSFVENLNSIDVSHVDATFTTLSGGTPFREDIARSDDEFVEAVFKNAPKSENGYFVVPKIIE
ncbi:Asp-tRNA(Asn)/Glu-tRNA(Gln) amidotransferase subunit GatC [Arcobacter sp. FWKO B]|uniref:Asp-tRNA(Asn)/Glu-tRNA(Gln) amidotransferase subunit GatC n=1 Tax=Arcobacter sp. FWKO B TaxID=2593672 RepID=UPI0018A39A86|nr:Asp-tRNA(Asn)/Glu-tRNA(Gln) amidotransferase subunit GatC [Arcobacter sp. FWKO B]QOG11671.1 Asp-tRNA(Asn)/Glu-tRNA(Gln) amidotransferase subunit GatC [Arcobacter sp. FWKO B]